jgi:hypothetical protein
MLKVYIFELTITLCFTSVAFGQTKELNLNGIKINASSVDTTLNAAFFDEGEMPEFPGGTKKLIAFAKSRILYPQSAVRDNIEGSLILLFVINKKGKVTQKKIVQGVRADIDAVCLQMLNQMPYWKAGKLNNKPIEVYERWIIKFILE